MNVLSLRNLGLLLSTALAASLATETAFANELDAACPGYTQCPQVDFAKILATDMDALRNEDEISATERRALAAAAQPGLTLPEKKAALGAILAYDRNLSVNRDQACISCHTPSAGFAGGVSALNTTTATFPGSVRIRTFNRKPESLAYGVFAPVLYYSPSISDARRGGTASSQSNGVIRKAENSEANFIGGNFFDSRATGLVTGSPSADQAMFPPTNPEEMALPDHACAIYRISRGSYADVYRRTWGAESLAIAWPANADAICDTPNEGATDQRPLKLASADRALAEENYIWMAQSIAAFEATDFVSPFNSKFDAYLAGKAQLSDEEMAGLRLFNGKANCNACHFSAGPRPNFSDYTSTNIGIPKNPNNPYFHENANNGKGLVANPAGPDYVDNGLGGFLAGPNNHNSAWAALAPQYIGTFQNATLRNVAKVPRPDFKRAYMHNGYFTDLKTIVHFYNTRDVLPHCKSAKQTVGVDCWPQPEQPANLNTNQTGNLGLNEAEEEAVVAFLNTLSDGYFDPAQ